MSCEWRRPPGQLKDNLTSSYFPTYITEVGLYDDQNTLMVYAKLSKPIQKDFTKEALIRVKLDF